MSFWSEDNRREDSYSRRWRGGNDGGSGGYSKWKKEHPAVPRPEDLLFLGLTWLARAAQAALDGKLEGSDE